MKISIFNVIIGLIIFLTGQYILKRFIEPIKDFKMKEAELVSKLYFYKGEFYLTDNDNLNWFNTYKEIRNVITDYISFYSIIPFKKLIPLKRYIILIPNKNDFNEIIRSLNFIAQAPLYRRQNLEMEIQGGLQQFFLDSMVIVQTHLNFEFPEFKGKRKKQH